MGNGAGIFTNLASRRRERWGVIKIFPSSLTISNFCGHNERCKKSDARFISQSSSYILNSLCLEVTFPPPNLYVIRGNKSLLEIVCIVESRRNFDMFTVLAPPNFYHDRIAKKGTGGNFHPLLLFHNLFFLGVFERIRGSLRAIKKTLLLPPQRSALIIT